jgi:hypothetical protein
MTHSSSKADRSIGGPGSSRHNAQREQRDPNRGHGDPRTPGEPTNPERSRVSGGGGEQVRHHTHDLDKKS